jgi:hypothetical protein
MVQPNRDYAQWARAEVDRIVSKLAPLPSGPVEIDTGTCGFTWTDRTALKITWYCTLPRGHEGDCASVGPDDTKNATCSRKRRASLERAAQRKEPAKS